MPTDEKISTAMAFRISGPLGRSRTEVNSIPPCLRKGAAGSHETLDHRRMNLAGSAGVVVAPLRIKIRVAFEIHEDRRRQPDRELDGPCRLEVVDA
ncbi:hypothetical protein M2175_001278 [Bradyrhizobium elkanii]|nr:hypothetical protein [Bradyrhizobium elkanii]MCS3966800.1 hypothetical protein [Bradyrhizobium japonicum]